MFLYMKLWTFLTLTAWLLLLLALELLKNEEVRAIVGPPTSPEAKFVSELGAKAQVPIISFSATSSSLSPSQRPYFIQTAVVDSSQLKGITAIVQGFGWQEVVIVYEDMGYHDGFIRYLTYEFQEAGIRIPSMTAISTSAKDSQILDELYKLQNISTRVFLVHMTPNLGSRVFVHANAIGMMNRGYAWLITDSLSNFLGSMDAAVIDKMEGVLGIRPYVTKSKDLEAFKMRWERNSQCTQPKTDLNIFGLWAYDTVWALAMAVERIGPMSSGFVKEGKNQNTSDIATLGYSDIGPRLLKEILQTRFTGLSGEFNLVNGQLQTSAFEILHIIGKGERPIGYWTPRRGLSRDPFSTDISSNYSTSVNVLKNIIWPGDSTVTPRDWALPAPGKRLKVGVPVKEGFTEFIKIEQFENTGEYNITGFCADLFREISTYLPFKIDNPQFIPFGDPVTGKSAGSYDDLLRQLELKEYDAVVGDVTILAERAARVEFSRPYLETEVVMVRQIKYDKGKDIWIFLEPFSLNLWITIAFACIFIGFVIRTLERRVNSQQKLGTVVWFPLASLAFPERDMVASKWSKFVLVIWLFTAFIVMQSYTANLSSILTVARLQLSTNRPYCIGCQEGSFVRELLVKRLNYSESKVYTYSSAKDYHDALSKGCRNGGVDAILDELPFIKIFLDTYGESNYELEGSSYKTGGLGFAFPLGSRLTPYISMALLNLTGTGAMHAIITKNFGLDYSDRDYFHEIPSYGSSLGVRSLAGLFIVSGSLTILALIFSTPSFCQTVSSMKISRSCVFPSSPSDRVDSGVHSTVGIQIDGNGPTPEIHRNSFRVSIQSDADVQEEDNGETDNNSDNSDAIIDQGDVNRSS